MLELHQKPGPSPKCYFTSSLLPAFVDHEQISTKKRPFSTIAANAAVHTLDVILPHGTATDLKQALTSTSESLKYAKVYMKPAQILEGDFFNQYIKTGNIIMLSEGRPGVDRILTLIEGVMRMEVEKATFERMGLDGHPIPTKGKKHVHARYAIELNLRELSMVRGKKAFERVIWAFKNVLDQSLTWLFCDLTRFMDASGPIAQHQPIVKMIERKEGEMVHVLVPGFPQEIPDNDYEATAELLEWVTLAILKSPRILANDNVDSAVSRYEVPDLNNDSEASHNSTQTLAHLRWHGLLPSKTVLQIYLAALKASADGWFALRARSFDDSTYTILQNSKHTMSWEYAD